MIFRALLAGSVVFTMASLAFAQEQNEEPSEAGDVAPSQDAADAERPRADEQPPPEPPPPEPPAASELPPAPLELPEEDAFEPPPGDISLEEWNRDDWMLLKPSVSLLELRGYFRVRGDLFRKLDFDNDAGLELPLSGDTQELETRFDSPLGEANYARTNIRLRLEPQINVSDQIQVFTTIDVFDNIILGSTPRGVPPLGPGSPANLVANTQIWPQRGANALTDSILVKRVWARLTGLNEQLQLRVGRMPNHWGLGMMVNDGDCLDCDFGDITDRIALSFRAADHIFSLMYDWVATGPLAAPFYRDQGQLFDAIDRDDVSQYSVQVEKKDHPRDIEDRLQQGERVFNYGLWNIFRTQDTGLAPSYYDTFDPAAPIAADQLESREGFLYTVDGYGHIWWGDLELSAEAAFVWGSFRDQLPGSDIGGLQDTDVYQLGAAFEGAWRLPGQRAGSALRLRAGGASGDSMPGFGALDRASTQRGDIGTRFDNSLNNFQFSPDYHVDLLLFRRIIGTVTDAWYVSPGVTYMFDRRLAGNLQAVYSQAIFKRTVPGDTLPMGLELDGEISYGLETPGDDPSPLAASFAGGLLFPLGAFDNAEGEAGGYAWTLQGRIYITF